MRIGISTRGINQGSYAISTIVLHLTQEIIDITGSKHEIILYGNTPEIKELFPAHIKCRSLKMKSRFIWDQIWLPAVLKRDKVDIALFMKGTMPLVLPCRGAVIFHDLGYFDSKLKPYRYHETIYMKIMMRKATQEACIVFADSKYTRTEAVRIFNVDPQKVHVCYQDVSPIFKPENDPKRLDEIKRAYRLPMPFILCPISLSPRKNLFRILKAFESVQEKIPHHLVLTGGQAWGIGQLLRKLNLKNDERIHIIGHVSAQDMPVLYSLASFALYPSLLEGFGMPILEAFRCGCPIITSNITSMPEVAGNAAYLVDPYEIEQIAIGVKTLATDHELRKSLVSKGHEQAQKFSWKKTAQIIVQKLEICNDNEQ